MRRSMSSRMRRMRWLGHADISFTLRTYVHAQPEAPGCRRPEFCATRVHIWGLTLRSCVRDTFRRLVTIRDNFDSHRTSVQVAEPAYNRSGHLLCVGLTGFEPATP